MIMIMYIYIYARALSICDNLVDRHRASCTFPKWFAPMFSAKRYTFATHAQVSGTHARCQHSKFYYVPEAKHRIIPNHTT